MNEIIKQYIGIEVTSGFSSPVADYMEEEIDFNHYLKLKPNSKEKCEPFAYNEFTLIW